MKQLMKQVKAQSRTQISVGSGMSPDRGRSGYEIGESSVVAKHWSDFLLSSYIKQTLNNADTI